MLVYYNSFVNILHVFLLLYIIFLFGQGAEMTFFYFDILGAQGIHMRLQEPKLILFYIEINCRPFLFCSRIESRRCPSAGSYVGVYAICR